MTISLPSSLHVWREKNFWYSSYQFSIHFSSFFVFFYNSNKRKPYFLSYFLQPLFFLSYSLCIQTESYSHVNSCFSFLLLCKFLFLSLSLILVYSLFLLEDGFENDFLMNRFHLTGRCGRKRAINLNSRIQIQVWKIFNYFLLERKYYLFGWEMRRWLSPLHTSTYTSLRLDLYMG